MNTRYQKQFDRAMAKTEKIDGEERFEIAGVNGSFIGVFGEVDIDADRGKGGTALIKSTVCNARKPQFKDFVPKEKGKLTRLLTGEVLTIDRVGQGANCYQIYLTGRKTSGRKF